MDHTWQERGKGMVQLENNSYLMNYEKAPFLGS